MSAIESATSLEQALRSAAAKVVPKPEPACMRADELARFLGVNRKTIYEYAARNVIPCRRLGRRFVFSREAVLAWLARQSGPITSGGR
jgi:excisionase family DNA binding protein